MSGFLVDVINPWEDALTIPDKSAVEAGEDRADPQEQETENNAGCGE